LVITASSTDFVTVKRVINRLDIPRDQVYVEVVIMEVQISRGFDYSANIISPPSMIGSMPNNDLMNFITNPLSSSGGLIGFPLGPTTTINVPNGQPVTVSSVMGLIKLIQSTTNSNVLATPQIIALDNAEATFESSEKIPIQTNTVIPNVGTQQSFTKEPVILSIKIKPQINKVTNFVKLDVTAKHGDLGNNVPAALVGQTFSTLDRTAQTTVVVGDSDTIVLGGMIRDKTTDSVKKIPLLGDLPLLGWLFKAKSSSIQKSNLLIFMTPHIVRQYEKIRTILDKKLKERDDFIETTAGGEDLLRYQRDAIIRSLPDIQELSKTHPDTSIVGIEDDVSAAKAVPASNPGARIEPPQLNPEGRVGPVAAPPSGPSEIVAPITAPNPSTQENP
jgi:general secretion pathway protein D